MKKELRLYGRYLLQNVRVVAVLTAVLLAGFLLLKSGSNLFATYVSMYPVFALLFPFVFATSARAQLNMAIAFGGKRMPSFAAFEIMLLVYMAIMTVLTKIVACAEEMVPNIRFGNISVTAGHMLFFMLFGFIIVQIGILLGMVMDGKKRTLLCVLTIIGVMGSVFVVLFLVLRVQDGLGQLSEIVRFRLTDISSWIIFAILAAVCAALMCAVAGRFRKAEYNG